MIKTAAIFAFAFALPLPCVAASCDDYPNTPGIALEPSEGSVKIIATGVAPVSFDDVSAVADARDEATLLAKAEITKFLTESIRNDQTLNRAAQETKTLQGDSKAATRKQVVEQLKQVSTSSQTLLKGVVPLGECYTKGQEFRVSVGVKPETLSMADSIAQGMSSSSNRGPSAGSQNNPPGQKLNGIDGFSRTEGLKKF